MKYETEESRRNFDSQSLLAAEIIEAIQFKLT